MNSFIEKISLNDGSAYIVNYVKIVKDLPGDHGWTCKVYVSGDKENKPLMTVTRKTLAACRNEVWKIHARSPKAPFPTEKASKS